LLDNNPQIDRSLVPEVHYQRAKALGEMAERQRVRAEDEGMQVSEETLTHFRTAIEHARQALNYDPAKGEAYAVLGISLAGVGEFDNARMQCLRAIRLLPQDAEVRWYLGRIYNRQQQYDDAIAILKDAIDRAPKDYRLHKTIARSYFAAAKEAAENIEMAASYVDNAYREYQIAIRLNADDADLYYESGQVLEYAAGQGWQVRRGVRRVDVTLAMMVDAYRKCVAADSEYTEAHLRLGHLLSGDEQHELATEHFRTALQLEPDRDQLYGELGQYYWRLDRRSDAYQVYHDNYERNPEHVPTLYALGRLSLEMDENEQGAEWLDLVLRENRHHAMAHPDLTALYVRLQEPRDALRHASDALATLEDEDQIVRVHRFAGLAHWQLDEAEELIEHLQGNIDGADDIRLPLGLGWALSLDGQHAGEVEALARQALAIDADSVEAKELLGVAQLQAGTYQVAEKTFRAAGIESAERAAWRVGIALFRQGPGKYAEAKPLLETAEDFRARRSHLEDARDQVRDALRTIRRWERDEERRMRDEAREAKRRAEEEARKARDARREAAEAAEAEAAETAED